MQTVSDLQLLRRYVFDRAEDAFAELVRRYTNFVYSAALRQVGSPDAAGEVAHRVFMDLARKAGPLAAKMCEKGSLVGWLHRATRYLALNSLREERRREFYQKKVMEKVPPVAETSIDWSTVSPLLDEAMSVLPDCEKEAVLLRYFRELDFRAVGASLGITEGAAQKRVERGVEKLRVALGRRGVTTTASALSFDLSAHAIQTAPAALATVWINAALAGTKANNAAVLTMIKFMSMTKLQVGLCASIVAGLTATLVVQHRSHARFMQEEQGLRGQLAMLAIDNANLSNRLEHIAASSFLSDDQEHELLRLRGEVGLLRDKTNQLGRIMESAQQLQMLRQPTQNQTGEQVQFAAHRQDVVNAATQIGVAIAKWAANNSQFPSNLADVHNELADTTNFEGNVPLDGFELLNVGKLEQNQLSMATARERIPRQSPDGGWERIYLIIDGSVDVATSPNGNFDSWEQSNGVSVPPQ